MNSQPNPFGPCLLCSDTGTIRTGAFAGGFCGCPYGVAAQFVAPPPRVPGPMFGIQRSTSPLQGTNAWLPSDFKVEDFGGPVTPRPGPPVEAKLPPMNCVRCNFRNEYVGKEHLDDAGVYKCRTCKGTK